MLQLQPETLSNLADLESREWLVTNGIGGYACGSVSGLLTRHYHGLLIAALQPPLARTLLLTKLDEQVETASQTYALQTDRWANGALTSLGYRLIEQFRLEGTVPVWTYACGDARLEKRIWMAPGANTTYVQYRLVSASQPVTLTLKALVNYRDHHSHTQAQDWQMQIEAGSDGLKVQAFDGATPFYLQLPGAAVALAHSWYRGYHLAVEAYRGLYPYDDHLHAATFTARLVPGQPLMLVASTSPRPDLDAALSHRQQYEQALVERWSASLSQPSPAWLNQLVLAADQFIVDRSVAGQPGKTVIAGYPWFTDWGRDTMIALPGLAIAASRPEIARPILRTFAQYLDRGMLPNVFPEASETPAYNTVDATLWYFEAVRAYYQATQDRALLADLFPALVDIIDWHRRGTRYQIHLDSDGLIYAGEPGVQLTWMDAKVDDWVVTPRIGKPIEISALWYRALTSLTLFAQILERPADPYQQLAAQTRQGFQRFWQPQRGYCYDLLDGPTGPDDALRPNQIFAVSLTPDLLPAAQQKAIVDTVAQQLLTPYGLRSLAPDHPNYHSRYGGDRQQRDGAYHQGTVWSWLIGPFVQAHLSAYRSPAAARQLLQPLADHLRSGCIGTLSEIFDGDPPHLPRGAFAQAWSVAEVLRVYRMSVSCSALGERGGGDGEDFSPI
ncbi:MAG: glycogen debranching protein [Leptolyngbya sp. SIO4C1]|nr:glycogen debranching protein [Leptolyngbya sp. SIO4C1]